MSIQSNPISFGLVRKVPSSYPDWTDVKELLNQIVSDEYVYILEIRTHNDYNPSFLNENLRIISLML